MSEALIQSAQVLPKVVSLPWSGAVKPGTALTTVGTSQPGVDLAGFAARDRELAWRDVSLAQAIKVVAERAAAAFQIPVAAPTIPADPAVTTVRETTGTVASGAISLTLTGFVKPGSLTITLASVATTDDGRGRLVPKGSIKGGTIDYQSGALALTTVAAAGAVAAITYKSVKYLEANTAEVDSGQSSLPGSYSDIALVDNSSVPDTAIATDKHLYRRDLLLYEVVQRAAEIFQMLQVGLPYDDLLSTNPVPANNLTVTPWPNWLEQRWSQARAAASLAEVGASQRWGPQVYADPDRNLAWRDNVLAWYAAQLSQLLGFKTQLVTGDAPLLTERGEIILTELGQPLLPERTSDVFTRTGACELFERANRLLVRVVDSVGVPYLLTELGARILTEQGTPIWLSPPTNLVPSASGPATPTIWTREATTYLLKFEDASYRIFQAVPQLAHGELSIIYDRQRREVRWRTEQPAQVHEAREAAPIFEGLREEQYVQVIADLPSNHDSAYFRSLAEQWQPTGYQEELFRRVNMDATNPGAGALGTFTAGLRQAQRAIFCQAGSSSYWDFEVDGRTMPARQLWWGFNVALNPTIKVSQVGSGYSGTDSSQSYTVSGTALLLTDADNQTIGWRLKLPAGSYRVKFQWQDASTARTKVRAVVKYAGQQVFGGLWQATSSAEQDSLPATILAVSSSEAILSLTVTPGSQAANDLRINGFTLERLTIDPAFQYRLNMELCDRAGSTLTPIAGTKRLVRGWLQPGQFDVCGTGWVDASLLADKYEVSLKLTLLDQPLLPLTISACDQRRLVSVAMAPNPAMASQLKSSLLRQAVSSVQVAYRRSLALTQTAEFRTASGSAYVWTAASSEAWLTRLALLDSRVREAFRLSSVGDLGRPALVPRGLVPGRLSVAAELGSVSSAPELAPLQPWMLDLNLPVAHEAFWTTPAPEPELQVV